MKKNLFYYFVLLVSCMSFKTFAQVATNTVDYKITYDPATQVYSVFVVPNYATPNAINLEAIEKGATAQVSLKVPNGFVISNITDVNGIWDKSPIKLGPNQQAQYTSQGLPADKAYYVIGKGASETNYGQFISGTSVPLFTFTGNGCFGPVEIIQKTDLFITVSDNVLSFNTAPSFYSRSGQPAGGNQQPLEQYNAPAGAAANCFSLTNDTFTAFTNAATSLPVLTNDSFNGSSPMLSSKVNVSVPTQPTNGSVIVNTDGTLSYTSSPGFAGVETITYQVCDKANPTVCQTATVMVTVSCPTIAAPVANVTAQPTCAIATGTITVTAPANGTGITYTVTGTLPVVAAVTNSTGAFTGLAAGVYSVTTSYASGCTSSGLSLTINAQPATPVAPVASVTAQPTCAEATGTITVTSPANGTGITYTVTGTTPVVAAVTNSTGAFTGLAAGVYSIKATNASGCTSTTLSLTVNAQPATPAAPVASVTSQPTCAVATGTITVTAPANGTGITYTVTGTLPVVAAVTNSTGIFTGLASGVYSIKATNASGCTSSGLSLTINTQPATPVAPVASVTAQPTCAEATGTITVTSPTNGTGITYTVTGTTPVVAAVTNSTGIFTGLAAGLYSVKTTNASGCMSSALSLTVNAQPATPAAPVATSPVTYCQGASATQLTATTAPSSSLRWYTVVTGGTPSTLAPTPVTTALGTTSFYVSSLASNGCESTTRTKIDVTVIVCRVIYAYNDNNITPANTSVTGNVLTNDNLNNGTGPLVVATTPVVAPLHGSLTLAANGTYSYIPSANYAGVDSFQYSVCDSGSPAVCVIATVTIDIYAPIDPLINNKPIALVDNFSTTKGVAIGGNVLSNDKDPDAGQTLTATKLSNPTSGTVVFNSNGTFIYTPIDPNFVGTDSFIYTACDNGSPTKCDDATVQIIVKDTPAPGANLPPVASDDYATTPNSSPVTGNLLANDKDPEGTTLVINTTPISSPTKGTIVINSNGTYTYTPTPGATGVDKVVYEVCDSGFLVACSRATLYIQITNGKVAIRIKAYLQGALFGVNSPDMLMRDDLRVKNLIPTVSPYPAMGFTTLTPTASAGSSVFTPTGADAIVDWVFIELRDAANNQQVIDSRSALIQRDGDIVDIDGISPLTFTSAQPASYYVVVKHRNHLSVMTKTAVPLTSVPTLVDFTLAATPTYTINSQLINQAQVVVDQGVAMWAGNSLYDNQVIYQGTQNDVNPIYQLVINATGNVFVTPFYKIKTYNNGDINMNGETIFQGTQNDVEFIYQNIIKNHPGNVLKQNFFIIKEQLP